MDHAAPANQILLRHDGERRQYPGMDRRVCLCARRYHQEAAQIGGQPLHNSTDFERHALRENTTEQPSTTSRGVHWGSI